jgi:hypothetical protein
MKPIGNDLLLQDRFDSIFRRGVIEPDAPTNAEKKRQRKAKYKMVSRITNKAAELKQQNDELKRKNDLREKGIKHQVKDDVIMI